MMHAQKNFERTDPAQMGFKPIDNGRIWLDGRFKSTLTNAGLSAFEQIMTKTDGRCEKSLEDREVWHFRIPAAKDESRGLYVKKHHIRTWDTMLRAVFGLPPRTTPGRVEAANVAALTHEGIDVMRLLAYGEKINNNGVEESFVITEELENFTEMHHYLRRRYAASRLGRHTADDYDLRQLISDIARIARQFHAAGYNHRDLYCRHFLIKDMPSKRREIRLIDLQRVQRRRWFRRRWIVKDLAQLAWSAPRCVIKSTHKVAFLHDYFGVRKLTAEHKSLVREVLAKQRRMEKRMGVEM